MKRILNKWQFVFIWSNSWARHHERTLVFGIFKMTSFPPQGEYITKKNYKGFIVDKIWKPFEIDIEFLINRN